MTKKEEERISELERKMGFIVKYFEMNDKALDLMNQKINITWEQMGLNSKTLSTTLKTLFNHEDTN